MTLLRESVVRFLDRLHVRVVRDAEQLVKVHERGVLFNREPFASCSPSDRSPSRARPGRRARVRVASSDASRRTRARCARRGAHDDARRCDGTRSRVPGADWDREFVTLERDAIDMSDVDAKKMKVQVRATTDARGGGLAARARRGGRREATRWINFESHLKWRIIAFVSTPRDVATRASGSRATMNAR